MTINKIVPMDIRYPSFCSSKPRCSQSELYRPDHAEDCLQMQGARPEQAQQTDDDEINRDDVIQQSRHHQDQDAGNQRNQWTNNQMQVHGTHLDWELFGIGSFLRLSS